MEKYTEVVVCPLCDDGGTVFGEEQVRLGESVIHVCVRQCEVCKLVFTSPRLNEFGLNYLYNQGYEKNSGSSVYCSNVHGSAPEYAAISNLVRKYLPGSGNVLDFGCGEGNLLLHLSELNIYELDGIEMSVPASEKAVARGLRVNRLNLKDPELASHTMNVITMMYVLEHVAQPLEVLGSIKKLLSKNGVLIVAVPNYTYLKLFYTGPVNFLLRGQRTSLMAGEHLFNYTPKTLEAIANRAGFEVIEWQSAMPHPVGSNLVRFLKKGAWLISKVCFKLGFHIGGIHAVLRVSDHR